MDQTNYQEKYHLYCKASCGMPYNALPPMYRRMRQILTEELPQLLTEQPPANDLAIYDSFRRDLELLKYYCHFPSLFSKNVVALGGRFSSGKSTFINRLLGDKQLSADVNPTTSVPTYLLKGEENIIYAQNFLERVVALNETEFASLVHDEDNEFGSSISRLFTSVYIEQENFKWDNLAILDTPGYSKPDNEEETVTDKNIAKSQLNSADYILWLISAEDGTITEEDLQFLASLYPHIPKLILLNKADKKSEEDIVDIVALIKRTLQQRNIQYEDVIPVSARPRSPFTTDVIAEKLDQWNDESSYYPLARDFKNNWLAINQYYQAQLTQAQTRVSDLNRIVMLADNDKQVAELEALKTKFLQRQENLRQLQLELREAQVEFFQQLNLLGESLGIELKEPMDIKPSTTGYNPLLGKFSDMSVWKMKKLKGNTFSAVLIDPDNKMDQRFLYIAGQVIRIPKARSKSGEEGLHIIINGFDDEIVEHIPLDRLHDCKFVFKTREAALRGVDRMLAAEKSSVEKWAAKNGLSIQDVDFEKALRDRLQELKHERELERQRYDREKEERDEQWRREREKEERDRQWRREREKLVAELKLDIARYEARKKRESDSRKFDHELSEITRRLNL